MKQSKNKGLTLKNKLKLSLSNFMERKWRNLLIATATSIGFIGVLISFGLGNAIVGMILGILSVVLCWVPVIGLVLGIIALILSIKGLKNSKIIKWEQSQ